MKKKRVWLNILYITLPLLIVVAIAAIDPNVQSLGDVFGSVDRLWIAAAFGAVLLFYTLEGVEIKIISGFMGHGLTNIESANVAAVGLLYSALTPFSSGGQPMQVIRMRKYDVPVGASTSMLVLKFMLWQASVTVFGIIGLVFLMGRIMYSVAATAGVAIWSIVGFAITLAIVIVSTLVIFKPKWIRSAGNSIINFIVRIRLLKNHDRIERAHASWERTIDDYEGAIAFARLNRFGMVRAELATFAAMIAYMSVTYFIYRAFGFNTDSFITIAMLQCIHYVVVAFMPLPGASGASEGGFYLFMGSVFPGQYMFAAMLIWRSITYYFTVFANLIVMIVCNALDTRREKRLNRQQQI